MAVDNKGYGAFEISSDYFSAQNSSKMPHVSSVVSSQFDRRSIVVHNMLCRILDRKNSTLHSIIY